MNKNNVFYYFLNTLLNISKSIREMENLITKFKPRIIKTDPYNSLR